MTSMEQNQNENQPQTNAGQSALITTTELQAELDKIESKWIRIPKGEAIVVRFHTNPEGKPIIYTRMQIFKDKKTGQELPPTKMVDFELEDTLKEGEHAGEHKLLSRNIKNSDVATILDFLKQGKYELMLSSDNNGKVNVAAVKR
jgi:hypothetical protein